MKIHLLMIMTALLFSEEVRASKKWTSIKIRNGLFNLDPKQEAYIDMPKSIEDARLMDFEIVRLEKEFSFPMHLYCLRDDPRLCLFYDESGFIAGLQMSFLESDLLNVDPSMYDFSSNPNFIKTDFFNMPAYSFRVFFTNPMELTYEGRTNRREVAEGLWAELDGELVRFDIRCQPNSPVEGNFSIQGCYPHLGQIYGRNFDEWTVCQDVFFVYLLYEGGSMVGYGLGIPGIASPGPHYDIYNRPSGPRVFEMLPQPPPCYYNYFQYGFTVVNVYLISDPWNIRCPKCNC